MAIGRPWRGSCRSSMMSFIALPGGICAANARTIPLQSTALVHEAYLRMVDQKNVRWQNRAHFFGVAAQSIRHILVDHARSHLAAKRGAGAAKLSLDEAIGVPEKREVDLLALDRALEGLAALDPQQGKIVEL